MLHRLRFESHLAAFAQQHHGTAPMRLFQDKARTLAAAGPETESYRYPGPRPRTREVAIVMIADQIEATARSTPPVDMAAREDLVRRTVERLVASEELTHSQLAARDLSALHPALTRALNAMYHRRLDYPSTPDDSAATARPTTPG